MSKIKKDSISETIQSANNPLFVCDNDCDGVASFLLLTSLAQSFSYVIARDGPEVTMETLSDVTLSDHDLVVILDKPMVDDEVARRFADVVWIDHHKVQSFDGRYYNPRFEGENVPVSKICYDITGEKPWLAFIGTVSDWYVDKVLFEIVADDYPDWVDDSMDDAGSILFETKLGEVVKMIHFSLGSDRKIARDAVTEVMRCESIGDVWHSQMLSDQYETVAELYEQAYCSHYLDEDVVVCRYRGDVSFTSTLANELFYEYGDHVVIVGRESKNRIIMSVRGEAVRADFLQVLEAYGGKGGGHENACGGSLKLHHFNSFVEALQDRV